MTLSPARGAAARARFDRAVRLIAVTVLGFASGLPLALTGQAMQAWLSADGIDIATIGFLSLVGLPYTFKFLWAPLMDRFEPPWLGRRRGWLVLSQLALAGALVWMASTPPSALARRLRPARLPGGHALGLAGRRRRRLPHRPAARGGARHGLVAERARLSAGDDPLRRHRLHLGRPAPGRRLELARGLSGDGPVHGRRGGGLGAADPQARRRGAAGERGAQRPARLSRGRGRGRRRLPRHPLRLLAAGARVAAAAARRRHGGASLRERWADLVALLRRHRLHPAAGRLGGAPGPLRDLARRPEELFRAAGRRPVPRLHRPLQAARRLRRRPADAVPAAGDAVHAPPRSASSTR